jgi:hypothetical protein
VTYEACKCNRCSAMSFLAARELGEVEVALNTADYEEDAEPSEDPD